MYDTNDLIKAIKQLGVDAFEATKPVTIVFGKVTSASPLQIQIDQKLTLTDKQLILSRNVTDYTIKVTMDWKSEIKSLNANHTHTTSGDISVNSNATVSPNDVSVNINNTVSNNVEINEVEIPLSHNHDIKGTKNITIHNKLLVGDQVILLRMQGGQKYIVLDRIGG